MIRMALTIGSWRTLEQGRQCMYVAEVVQKLVYMSRGNRLPCAAWVASAFLWFGSFVVVVQSFA